MTTSESPAQARALGLAVRHVNTSTPAPITESMLLTALATGTIPAGYEQQFFALIDETDRATLCDLVISTATTYAQLALLADEMLPPAHTTRIWLDERRDL